ncbi:MAG: DUF1634 domain-containing protein [Alphaproteobacteria bacterium]
MPIETETTLPRIERHLATLLHYGTWIASLVIAAGLLLAYLESVQSPQQQWGMATMTVGIALFILLPVLRLVLMIAIFVHERDYRFGLIATLVFAIIVAGTVLGYIMPSHIAA